MKTAGPKTKRFCRQGAVCTVAAFTLFFCPHPAQGGPLYSSVHPVLGGVVSLLQNKNLSPEADGCSQNKAELAESNKSIGWEIMAQRILAGLQHSIPPGSRTEAVALMSCFLKTVFLYKSDAMLAVFNWFYRQDTSCIRERMSGSHAVLLSRETDRMGDCPMGLKFVKIDNRWVICDFTLHGLWVVQSYRDQCREILSRDSAGRLLQALRRKARDCPGKPPCSGFSASRIDQKHLCNRLPVDSSVLTAGLPLYLLFR